MQKPSPIALSEVALNSNSAGQLKLYLGWLKNMPFLGIKYKLEMKRVVLETVRSDTKDLHKYTQIAHYAIQTILYNSFSGAAKVSQSYLFTRKFMNRIWG